MDREKLISLVTATQAGNSNAINELFNAFYNDVYFFALKTCGDEDTACEVTQETFIEIINTIGSLQEPAAFVTWMKQIAYHQCTRFFRKQKSRDKYETLAEENEDGVSVFDFAAEDRQEFIPDEAVDQKDFRRVILEMLDHLSPEQRSALMLYYYDELSVKQIAEIQSVSESAVKSRLFHGRQFIKKTVEDYEKKNDVKLHSIGLFPLFLLLFQNQDKLEGGALASVAEGVSAATGTVVAVSAVTVGTTTAAGTATATGLFASIPIAAKVVTAVAAISLTVGWGVAILSGRDDPAVTEPTIAVMATLPVTAPTSQTEPDKTLPPETTPPETIPPETIKKPFAPMALCWRWWM